MLQCFSVDERRHLWQRVVDYAAPLSRDAGVPRDADEHQGVREVPLHPEAVGQSTRRVLPTHTIVHEWSRHEQRKLTG